MQCVENGKDRVFFTRYYELNVKTDDTLGMKNQNL